MRRSPLAPRFPIRLVGRMRTPDRDPVSPHEPRVLELVAPGATNRKAAARLFISEATVKTHLLHLYEMLGGNDRAAAVAVSYDPGLPGARGGERFRARNHVSLLDEKAEAEQHIVHATVVAGQPPRSLSQAQCSRDGAR